jgi:predicted O-linked N-acetylglucosamine transferase (SPINDLY family)
MMVRGVCGWARTTVLIWDLGSIQSRCDASMSAKNQEASQSVFHPWLKQDPVQSGLMTPITIAQTMELAIGHHQAGRLAEAEALYRQVLAQVADHPGALHFLGLLAAQTGHPAAAIELIDRAIARKPDYAEAYSSLGFILAGQRRHDEAVATLRQAIALAPELAEAHTNLGNALREQRRLDEAIQAHDRAIELKPGYAEAHSNRGVALAESGRLDEAIAAFQRAIALRPEFPETFRNLGLALINRGRLDEASAALQRALALRPDYAEAHAVLGNVRLKREQFDEAIALYRRALELKPGDAEVFSNLGVALRHAGRLAESAAALGAALALQPNRAEVHNNVGSTLLAQGDREGALAAYQRALALKPGYAAAHSNVVLCMQYRPGVSCAGLAQAHAAWDERHAAPLRADGKPSVLDPNHDRDPERPLRLGFVSADLRRHPVGYFLIPFLENLDRGRFAVVCYSGRAFRDDLTDRLAVASNTWRDVVGMSDAELAECIRTDRIDILFDLAGHTAWNRLLVFARRPAPIQISWIGYVGTTGLVAMDYLIADRFHIPPGAEVHYRERVLRMPEDYVCFEPPTEAPAVGPLPALERGFVTFGSFNNIAKITPEVITRWAAIVPGTPGSRLLLATLALDVRATRERLIVDFAAAGLDPTRLELRGSLPRADLLAAYNAVDLALDTFPYSGGLTTCEALWMGVPVVTWPGETFAGRHSLSHLSNVGLTTTVAADPGAYVARALELAGDLPRLSALRSGLRARMADSPLCDGPRFAQHLMALLRQVWREHRRP